jgi:DNA-binding NarL/FixJ family response regulator
LVCLLVDACSRLIGLAGKDECVMAMTEHKTKISLLIVEDDIRLSSNMALILEMEGFAVRVAADGPTGLAMIRKKEPDLILCDILMPKMDGFSFREAVISLPNLAHVPFIFVSALDGPAQIRQGMLAGADDYLTKPFSAGELLAAVTARLKRFDTIRTVQKPRGMSNASSEELARLRQITPREREILLLVAKGFTSKEIATTLFISQKTVEVHRTRLMRKLKAANAVSLAYWAGLADQTGQPGKD